MIQLCPEALYDPIHVRRIPNHELDNILQRIVALGFSIKATLISLRLFEYGDLENHVPAEFTRLKLKPAEFAD